MESHFNRWGAHLFAWFRVSIHNSLHFKKKVAVIAQELC